MDIEALRKKKQQQKKFENARKESVRAFSTSTPSPVAESASDAEKHYEAGRSYHFGLNGKAIDLKKAYSEYMTAANLGNTAAMVKVALDYSRNDRSNFGYDPVIAERWGNAAIQNGNPDGYAAFAGCRISENEWEVAMSYLESGMKKGSLTCAEGLAYFLYYGYEKSDGEFVDDEERAFEILNGIKWRDEDTDALEILGMLQCYKYDDPKAGVATFERILKAEPYNFMVMARLGSVLRSNEQVQDYSKAKRLLQTAAENGIGMAMDDLGLMYLFGEEVSENLDTAIGWFRKAAEQELPYAMFHLGLALEDKGQHDESRYWIKKAAEEGYEAAREYLQENEQERVDTTRSDQIYKTTMDNLENTLNLSCYAFPERIKGIQKVIDGGGLSDYEGDRLKLLEGILSLVYFKEHFCDDDFYRYESQYYKILDKVDDYISSMTKISNEAAYVYYIANMYSSQRFQDTDPNSKLNEFWANLSEIEFNDDDVEFSVSFWKDMAKEVYELMSTLIGRQTDRSYFNRVDNSSSKIVDNDNIKNEVIRIVAKQLRLSVDKVYSYSNFKSTYSLNASGKDMIEIANAIQRKFGININDYTLRNMNTVGDLILYVDRSYFNRVDNSSSKIVDNDNIKNEVIRIVSKQLRLSVDKVYSYSNFKSAYSLNASGKDMIEIANAIQRKFGININDYTLRNMNTVGDLILYVETHIR